MKSDSSDKVHVPGSAKDFLVLALLFMPLCFIDISMAAFVSVITGALLITRRILLDFNPGVLSEIPLVRDEKELPLSKGIEVFDLSHVPAMEYLYLYIETTIGHGLLAPPRVLIIRFRGITTLRQSELGILRIAIKRLGKNKIITILADVTPAVHQQFISYGLEKITGKETIFRETGDAVQRAEKLVRDNQG